MAKHPVNVVIDRVRFGTKAYCITSIKWNSETQSATVEFEDDNGIKGTAFALGASKQEAREAVIDAITNER